MDPKWYEWVCYRTTFLILEQQFMSYTTMPHDKDRTVNLFSTFISMVQNLPLFPWKRMGGHGHFIQMYGTQGKSGGYVGDRKSVV